MIGFQGEDGAFSDEAARALGARETRGFTSFDALLAAVESGEIAAALLPWENSISGPVAAARSALERRPGLRVEREHAHAIEQCLLGVPGASFEGLRRVHSHPVALAQCGAFFARHPQLEPVPSYDTAGAVREIATQADPADAAIGPALCARRYGAAVLRRAVQDRASNVTRFLWVVRPGPRSDNRADSSLPLPSCSA